MTQAELSLLTNSGTWGDIEKFHSDLAFILILPEEVIAGEVVFGLAIVWVHPYQACIPTLDEAARELSLLTTSSKSLAYAFVCLNGDAQHVPLSKEGHLSMMIKGPPSRSSCGHLCQLKECLLLQSDD